MMSPRLAACFCAVLMSFASAAPAAALSLPTPTPAPPEPVSASAAVSGDSSGESAQEDGGDASEQAAPADAAAENSLHLHIANTRYASSIDRIDLTIHNGTDEDIELDDSFSLELWSGGQWHTLAAGNAGETGELAYTGASLKLGKCEQKSVSAPIAPFRSSQPDGVFSTGDYRITAGSAETPLTARFQIVGADCFADEARFTMRSERPAYDANIDYVKLMIENKTEAEGRFSTSCKLQYFTNGEWVDIPSFSTQTNAASYSLPVGDVREVSVFMSQFKTPMRPGRYRLIKEILPTQEFVSAEFDVLSQLRCVDIAQPASAAIDCSSDGGVTVVVNKDEAPEYVKVLWHELLAFQRAAQPPQTLEPELKITLTGAQRKTTELSFFAADERTYMKLPIGWGYVEETGFIDRVKRKARELGAYAPATGAKLLDSLNALAPLRDVEFGGIWHNEPFNGYGWKTYGSDIEISIFQFPSATALNDQMRYLYDNGYSIGYESMLSSKSFTTRRYNWKKQPHYFKAGSRLVIYFGSDASIINALTSLLGEQVKCSS